MFRKKVIYLIELMCLYMRHRKSYIDFLVNRKKKLYVFLEEHGCKCIRAIQLLEWKVWYGSYYFKGMLNGKKVFIKVTAACTKDGYVNEISCDDYIKKNSPFLAERTPKILLSFVQGDYYVLVFEYFDICKEINQVDLENAVCEFINEYSRIGLIHQDIKLSNLTIHNGKYCLIDYGYAICPNSDHIRLARTNYIDKISDTARNILKDADYYYDDIIAAGIKNTNRNLINFIVGKKNKYFIKLADNIFEYRLEQLANRPVYLLHKC